ncbi:MAG: glycosyltransferase family 2 protein [Cyanobacteria bacterium P01_D01_bin.115]
MTFITFSIVLETENLASADIGGFQDAIDSLLQQDVPISSSVDFIVIDTGELSATLKQEIKQKYPWMRFLPSPASLGYYEVKQLGAKSVAGEVVIYCDADCIYDPGWLRSLLLPFQDEAVDIVAGETMIPVTGVYSMAMAVNYMLHRQTPQPHLTPTGFYYLNNVAFRRQVVLDTPMPTDLPLYRGTCSIHSRILRKRGHKIWKQFSAKAYHAPPNGWQHYVWRFLVMGHDHYWLDIYFAKLKQGSQLNARKAVLTSNAIVGEDAEVQSVAPPNKSVALRATQKVQYIWRQAQIYLQDEPEIRRFLPFALPIVLFSQSLIFIGRAVTARLPHILLKAYLARFEPEFGNKLFAESNTAERLPELTIR